MPMSKLHQNELFMHKKSKFSSGCKLQATLMPLDVSVSACIGNSDAEYFRN